MFSEVFSFKDVSNCQSKFGLDHLKHSSDLQDSFYKAFDRKPQRSMYMKTTSTTPSVSVSPSPMVLTPTPNGGIFKKKSKAFSKPSQSHLPLHTPKRPHSTHLPSSLMDVCSKPKLFHQYVSKANTTDITHPMPIFNEDHMGYVDKYDARCRKNELNRASNQIISPPSEKEEEEEAELSSSSSTNFLPQTVDHVVPNFNDKRTQSAPAIISAKPSDILEMESEKEESPLPPMPACSLNAIETTSIFTEPIVRFRRSSWEGIASNDRSKNRFFQLYSILTKSVEKSDAPTSPVQPEKDHKIFIQHCKRCCPHNVNPSKEGRHPKLPSMFKAAQLYSPFSTGLDVHLNFFRN